MHFEVLVEDISGKKALEIIVPKIISTEHTYRIFAYKGIGRIPKKCKSGSEARKRLLLNNLPRLLRGYGKQLQSFNAAVIVVCDLDDKCQKSFRSELLSILEECSPQPKTRFCIAIEEGEAWFLGDIPAIKSAYPQAKESILNEYINDSICGTWEMLADAIHPGGAAALTKKGWHAIGLEKSIWAEKITPFMNINNNASLSFQYFRLKLQELLKSS